MGPAMVQNPKLPVSVDVATPAQLNPPPPRPSRPRVREVSSRFMSPAVSTPQPAPSTVRRSQTYSRQRYTDENRPESINRSSVSPVRSSKPRSAIKLFKENPRTDTPAIVTATVRILRQRSWDTAASKLLHANGISASSENKDDSHSGEDLCSIDGDCESVKSEPCEGGRNGGGGCRVLTPCVRSMDLRHEQLIGTSVMHPSKGGAVRVARVLNLPPMPPMNGGAKLQGAVAEVKKAVMRKGSSQGEDVHRLRMMYNHCVQWRFANAKAQASMIAQKKQSEKQLYAIGLKISELRDSVKRKCIEYRFLKEIKTLSAILDSQANVNEIEEALQLALRATDMICQQVQCFMPKAEQVNTLVSDLARVYSGETVLVDECGDLLVKTHFSQVEECSLRGTLMQIYQCKFDRLNE